MGSGLDASMNPSLRTRLATRFRRRPFDRDAALLGFLLGVLMLPLRFVLSHLFAETLPVVLVVASGFYLLAYREAARAGEVGRRVPTVPTPVARFAPALTFLGVAAMIVVVALAGARTPLFYGIAALAASSVLAQVFFAADEDLLPGLVFFQIVVLAGGLRFAALFTTPGFIGIDIWTHVTDLAVDLRETGSLSAIRDHAPRAAKYYASPLYHLLVVATSLLAGVSLESALYLSVGAGMLLTLPLAYVTVARFTSVRWALAGAALFAFSDHAIRWSIHLVPTSLSMLFYLAGFYYFLRVLGGHDVRDVALLVFFMVALTLSHPVSAFIMLVIIGTATAVQAVVTRDALYPGVRARNLSGLFAFQLGLVTLVWSLTPYRGETLTEVMLLKLKQTLLRSTGLFDLRSTPEFVGGGIDAQFPSVVERLIPYIDIMGFVFLLGLTVLGCLYALRPNRTTLASLLLVFVVSILTGFALFLPVIGVDLFIPGRWFVFMYLPMAALGALGLGHLARNLDRRLITALLLVLALFYPATMIVSTDATLDAPVFDHHHPRIAYTEPELQALSRIGAMVDKSRPLYTDSPYTDVFRRTETNPRATMLFIDPNTSRTPNDLIVYREYHTKGAPIFRVGDQTAQYPVERHSVCGPDRSVLYANGEVTMCFGEDPDAVASASAGGFGDGTG